MAERPLDPRLDRLAVGGELPELRVTVDVESMKVFTLIMHDPNPVHFDPAAVAALGLGDRLINQGTLNMAYLIDAIAELVGDAARVRSFRCRFKGSVFAGDEVVAGGEVTAIDRDGDAPTATFAIWLDRAGAERVLEGVAVVDLS